MKVPFFAVFFCIIVVNLKGVKLLRGQISLELFALLSFLLFGSAFFFLRDPGTPARKIASENIPPIAGEVWGPQNEIQINQIVAASERMLDEHTGGAKLMQRDAHPKQHGCARAYVDIDSSALPAQYRVGIFSAPTNGSKLSRYEAWSRFSNGSPTGAHGADLEKDIRGFALKLMNVNGAASGSQDLLLSTSSEFFSKNGKEYAAFHEALAKGNWFFFPWLAVHPKFAQRLLKSRVQIGNVLQTDYYSTVPYRLGGDHSMRFSTTACTPDVSRDHLPDAKDNLPDYLHTRLVSTLNGVGSECFNLFVQPNEDPLNNPIEDPTLAWSEKTSPRYPVGKIIFPSTQRDLDSEGINAFCENLNFNPWHTFPETRPVGQINRIRKAVYGAIAEERHAHNNIALFEPHDFKPCENPNLGLCKVIR